MNKIKNFELKNLNINILKSNLHIQRNTLVKLYIFNSLPLFHIKNPYFLINIK